MKKEVLLTTVGFVGVTLIPRTAHAHGGFIISNVTAAVFTAPVLLILVLLAMISAHLLRSSSMGRWRAIYGVLAIILSVAVIAVLILILMVGGPMGFAYGGVVLIAGWWSIRLASRVVRRNSMRVGQREPAR